MLKIVMVHWRDGHFEEFRATKILAKRKLLWICLEDKETMLIPLGSVKWVTVRQIKLQS